MNRNEKKKIANAIYKREKIINNESSSIENKNKARQEIIDLMASLSFDEMLEIDEYIYKKNNLTF